jgi:hypothetical protein
MIASTAPAADQSSNEYRQLKARWNRLEMAEKSRTLTNFCLASAPMQTAGGDRGSVSLLGWYADKNNNVELMMKESAGKWVLRQRVNRTFVAKKAAAAEVLPDTWYYVAVSFDSTRFSWSDPARDCRVLERPAVDKPRR